MAVLGLSCRMACLQSAVAASRGLWLGHEAFSLWASLVEHRLWGVQG